MEEPCFCVNAVIAKVVKDYVKPKDWSTLIAELEQHRYGTFKWKLVRDPTCTETDPMFSNIQRILFVNKESVILQSIELSVGKTRFDTNKVMFEDWDKVFLDWQDNTPRTWEWEECWVEGMRMYGAEV